MQTKRNKNTCKGIYEIIYKEVKNIPKGKVSTYGEIAQKVGIKDARIIGWALHANPDNSEVPCHRVVNKDGKLSDSFAFGGYKIQRELLLGEGVEFFDEKHVKL
jgi:methylated-DNA-protein-cysteine methyltransferase related protein